VGLRVTIGVTRHGWGLGKGNSGIFPSKTFLTAVWSTEEGLTRKGGQRIDPKSESRTRVIFSFLLSS
jgi:hypothetical protein